MDWLAGKLLAWFDDCGRKALPWQQNATPYRVWVSEIMLQQTQVQTVIPYYERFMARFPDVQALAAAELDEVLHLWSGLGYYARARNLHKTAILVANSGGEFPTEAESLEALPGIGRSTAGAIRAFAMGQRAAILDGNVKRVLARFHGVSSPLASTATLRELWEHAEAHTPAERTPAYTQAIMDLGAMVCVRRAPQCASCPLAERCTALATQRVDEIPQGTVPKTKPVRRARLYVITAPNRACLLERRPDQGIWGGLWSPPQRQPERSVEAVCAEFGISPSAILEHHTAPVFRHSFSHFHLDIEPHYLRIKQQPNQVADGGGLMWYAPDGAAPVGLSAPAAKLLAGLNEVFGDEPPEVKLRP